MAEPEADGTELAVDPSNAGAHAAWDGDDGEYWAAHADYFEASLAAYDDAFVAASGIASADHVLDIGCGTGRATRDAAHRASSGSALGVDLSSRMLDLARRRAREQGVANATFLQADAQVHPFEPASFDVAISHNGTMFFGDPVAAFTNVGRALRADGRLTLLVWQAPGEQEWYREIRRAVAVGRELPLPPSDAPSPFAQSDPDRVRSVLTAAGFADVTLDGHRLPMVHGPTADIAFANVSGLGVVTGLLAGLDDTGRRAALDALRVSVDAHATGDGVRYDSACWIVTARRP